ncbi:TPA: hypothetical protein ACH3X2_007457 [Trebouxia sp. C0005]
MRTASHPFATQKRSSCLLRVGSQATATFDKKRPCNQGSWKQGRQLVLAVHISQAARVVREIREEDVEDITCLQAKAFYDPWDNVWIDNFFLKLFEADVRGIINSKLKDQDKSRFQAFVAEGNGSGTPLTGVVEVSLQSSQEVVQALGAASGETYAYIACMAVAENSRRKGIALQLLQAAEKQAMQWDQNVTALHVYTTNDVAVKAYEKAGYTPLKRDGRWRTLLGARQRILMCKNLMT